MAGRIHEFVAALQVLLALTVEFDVRSSNNHFCCFDEKDVNLVWVGRNGSQPVLTVDNFLCPEALTELHQLALGKASLFKEGGGPFPGHELHLEVLMKEKMRAHPPGALDHLDAGHHLHCLQHALSLSHAVAKSKRIWLKQMTTHERAEKHMTARGEQLTNLLIELDNLPFEAFEHDLSTRLRRSRALKEAQGVGLLDVDLGEWALLNLLVNRSRDDQKEYRRFSFVSRLSGQTAIHVDPGKLAINLHLNPGYEDSGTSFWRLPANERDSCLGPNSLFQKCGHAMKTSDNRLQQLAADSGAPVLQLPHDVDHTGVWDQFAVIPMRENRMVVYSGHMAHSGYFPPNVVDRILANRHPSSGRLLFQDFVKVPTLLAWSIKGLMADREPIK